MPLINKAPKAIVFTIVAIVLIGLADSFWFSWLIPAVASIGGIVAFWGLWMEKLAEEAGEGTHEDPGIFAEKAYSIKHKANVGWWILMVGIFAEIGTGVVLAGRGAYEQWKNGPLNQPAQSASAKVTIIAAGIPVEMNGQNSAYLPASSWCKLAFGTPELFKTKAPALFSSEPIQLDLKDGNQQFTMHFDLSLWVFDQYSNVAVSDIMKWHKFEIGTPFLAPNTKIIAVKINLTVNNIALSEIRFDNQTVRDSKDKDPFFNSPTNGIAIFNETDGFRYPQFPQN